MVPFLNLVTERKTPTRVTKDELNDAVELLIEFKQQVLTFADYGEVARILGANEASLAACSEALALWAGPDAPLLKWAMPKEGGLSFVDVWAMIKDCPHRDLNHQIMNHILSPEAQAFQQMEATQQGMVVADAVPLLSGGAGRRLPL
jgi:spermidine/putrescine transport system substrate-binding protein